MNKSEGGDGCSSDLADLEEGELPCQSPASVSVSATCEDVPIENERVSDDDAKRVALLRQQLEHQQLLDNVLLGQPTRLPVNVHAVRHKRRKHDHQEPHLHRAESQVDSGRAAVQTNQPDKEEEDNNKKAEGAEGEAQDRGRTIVQTQMRVERMKLLTARLSLNATKSKAGPPTAPIPHTKRAAESLGFSAVVSPALSTAHVPRNLDTTEHAAAAATEKTGGATGTISGSQLAFPPAERVCFVCLVHFGSEEALQRHAASDTEHGRRYAVLLAAEQTMAATLYIGKSTT